MSRQKLGTKWPFQVAKEDLKLDFFRGSGPGGQFRNKVSTACRITHIPTGLSAQATEHRSQTQNKEAAFKKLAELLIPIMKKAVKNTNGTEEAATSEEVIRTYKRKDNLVIDKRTNKTFNYDDILDGKLDALIQAIIEAE